MVDLVLFWLLMRVVIVVVVAADVVVVIMLSIQELKLVGLDMKRIWKYYVLNSCQVFNLAPGGFIWLENALNIMEFPTFL